MSGKIISLSPQQQLERLKFACDEIVSEEGLLEQLTKSYETQTPLKIKFGADPSRPDIHIGHSVVLQKLKLFQDFGHEVIFLIGDFTAMIGDPTGKSLTRPQLSKEEVMANSKTYQEQVGHILDIEKARVEYNSTWCEKLSSADMIGLMAQVTVNSIIKREDFFKRYNEQRPIHLHEFLYPLLQAYDSVVLKADVELGGTDQTFNLMMGRELQKKMGQPQQSLLIMPLIEGTDGVNKMSKSLDNYIGLTDSPEDIFGKIMSISDELMQKYLLLLSRKAPSDIESFLKSIKDGSVHPLEAKKQLGQEIVDHYHPAGQGKMARAGFEARFSKKEIPDDLPEFRFSIDQKEIPLQELLKEAGFIKSGGELRRLLKQNAVKVDGNPHKDLNLTIEQVGEMIIKVGKLRMLKVIID